ncbi:MOXD2 protein, partial [Erpornis zantholeuca]|nr:MOXD2 protein [Erpornis zantholeuca]
MVMFFSRIKRMLLFLFFPCFCSGQLAPTPLHFPTLLDPSSMFCLCYDHKEQELMRFELHIPTTGWVASGFSPYGEQPGSDIVTGGASPNGSI